MANPPRLEFSFIIHLEKLPRMVKYDRKNKAFQDFEALLEEIMDCEHESQEDDMSEEDLEVEFSDTACDQESESVSSESVTFTPGAIYNFGDGRMSVADPGNADLSDDFPDDNEEMDLHYTTEQLARLTLVDREEYRNTKNVMKPKAAGKKNTRQCPNMEDE